MEKHILLPLEIEKFFNKYIMEKLNDTSFAKYTEEPIGEKVLDLLDTLCILVYYPLPDDDNNGFHITDMPFANGEKHNFVYINTAQTMEKQVFTAAHELGHIWDIDNYILEQMEIDISEDEYKKRESIINRFAAVLLMPEVCFTKEWEKEFSTNKEEDGRITILNLLKIIVSLMNSFFVPMRAVVLRLYELGIIHYEIKELLLENEKISYVANEFVQKLITDNGYVKFKNPTNKKWIEGFAEHLDKAEQKGSVMSSKINKMRELFEFPSGIITDEMNNEVQIKKQEGSDV